MKASNSNSTHDSKLPWILVVLIGVQVASTFLTDSKFIPEIRNNIGVFELTAAALFVATFILYLKREHLPVRGHIYFAILAIWLTITVISQFHYLSPRPDVGLTGIIILIFQIVFIFMMYNLLLLDPKYMLYVFRLIAVGAAIAALWVLFDQYTSGGDYNASGPFRGRSHTGIYMMGAFWILLMYLFWPQTSRFEKFLIYPMLALVLYGIGTSLRQSVYVGVIVGVAALVVASIFATGLNRMRVLVPIAAVAVVVFALLVIAPQTTFGPLALFNREFTNLGSRLESFAGADEDLPDSQNFDILQRRGGLRAFSENPLLGIGWGAFYRSEFSITGHEMHSTPFRFLAELGTVGLLLYLVLLGFNLIMGVRVFWLARNTPYQLSALVMIAAIISYATSHYYNRMFTDRPYWWMLVIILTFEYYLLHQVRAVEKPSVPTPEAVPQSLPAISH